MLGICSQSYTATFLLELPIESSSLLAPNAGAVKTHSSACQLRLRFSACQRQQHRSACPLRLHHFSLQASTASLSLLRFVRSFSACITATVSKYIAGIISINNHTILRNRVSYSISWSYAIETIQRPQGSKTINPRSTCSSTSWTI